MRVTKRAASIALDRLIEEYGTRLIVECCADYLRHLALDPWAVRYEHIARILRKEEREAKRRREAIEEKRRRWAAARLAKRERG